MYNRQFDRNYLRDYDQVVINVINIFSLFSMPFLKMTHVNPFQFPLFFIIGVKQRADEDFNQHLLSE